jgi:hypothetical protein
LIPLAIQFGSNATPPSALLILAIRKSYPLLCFFKILCDMATALLSKQPQKLCCFLNETKLTVYYSGCCFPFVSKLSLIDRKTVRKKHMLQKDGCLFGKKPTGKMVHGSSV